MLLHPNRGAGSQPWVVGQAGAWLFEGCLIHAPQQAVLPAKSNLCQRSCPRCVFRRLIMPVYSRGRQRALACLAPEAYNYLPLLW